MKRRKKAILAAGMLMGAAALTGCAAGTPSASSAPTSQTAQQQTAEPTPQTSPSMESADKETPAPIRLRVEDRDVDIGALEEDGRLFLPLAETGEALGWKAESESMEEESRTRRSISLTKEDSRITVTWLVSDNTASQITWQKDGLLVPVDTALTTLHDVVYVPAAFFEEAAGVSVSRTAEGIDVQPPASKDTPPTKAEDEK